MLRNLFMRGMIEKAPKNTYQITADALRFLGITSVEELPQFDQFSQEIEKRMPVPDFKDSETEMSEEDSLLD